MFDARLPLHLDMTPKCIPTWRQMQRFLCLVMLRFGVQQRAKLQSKNHPLPHLLSMTATPIPRTLALTVHGDMALSAIDQLPPGRQPVQTTAFQDNATNRKQVRQSADVSCHTSHSAASQMYCLKSYKGDHQFQTAVYILVVMCQIILPFTPHGSMPLFALHQLQLGRQLV